MRSVPVLAAAALLALGCASVSPDPPEGSAQDSGVAAVTPGPKPRLHLGFFEFDLVSLDRARHATTFRLLDFKIFKLLEIGSGPDYHSVSFVEIPDLFDVFTSRADGASGASELRIIDLQALALAPLRIVRDGKDSETAVMKLPVIGSMYGHETSATDERRIYLYLYRRDAPR